MYRKNFRRGHILENDLSYVTVRVKIIRMSKYKAKIETKYVYRGVCAVILTILACMIFFEDWLAFVTENNQTGHLLGLGNLSMAVIIYGLIYSIIGKYLSAFKIGVNRISNVLASQVLTLFTTDVVEILVSMAITGQFRFMGEFTQVYAITFVFQSVLICPLCILMIGIYRHTFPPLRMVEVVGDHVDSLSRKIAQRPDKYVVIESMKYDVGEPVLRETFKLYDAVLINDLPACEKNKILKICFDLDKRVYFTPKISDILVKSSDELNLFDTPLYFCRNRRIPIVQLAVKRLFDILLSLFALVVLSPLLLITALAIKLEDGGDVFFTQDRCTIDGRVFKIYKFRSMIMDAEKDGRPHPAGEKDDRITKVGRVIRACRIDELPQLINIVKGDMSIVGPRPERVEHVEMYTKEIAEFLFREKVKGGLTGYAQVYGKYNTSALDKLKLDMIYITNYSILLDIQIIFETVKILFQKESTEGFSEEQQQKVENFEEKDKDGKES